MLGKFIQLFSTSEGDHLHAGSNRTQIAATALMVELCRADQKIDENELKTIISIACNTFSLSPEEANVLLDEAKENNQLAVSLYEFTDIINRQCQKKEKIDLIENMWRVALADQSIDRYEEHLIRKIADLIYVNHSDFMRAKHRATADNAAR